MIIYGNPYTSNIDFNRCDIEIEYHSLEDGNTYYRNVALVNVIERDINYNLYIEKNRYDDNINYFLILNDNIRIISSKFPVLEHILLKILESAPIINTKKDRPELFI